MVQKRCRGGVEVVCKWCIANVEGIVLEASELNPV